MLKDLFFVCCLVMALSSYNAQFIDYPHHDSLSEARFPLLDPVEQLALKSVDRKALLSKLKNRLKEKNKNVAAPVASSSLPGEKQFGGGGFFAQLIQQIIAAILQYVESYLAPLFPRFFTTVTRKTTLTSFITCTKSTTACAGRRRRAALKDLMDDPIEMEREALSLASSMLLNNTGSSAEASSFNLDDAFSDYFDSLPYDDLPYYDPEELEGSIEMDPSMDPSMDPIRRKKRPIGTKKRLALKIGKDKKLRSSLMNIRQLPANEAAILLSQLGINTVTTTATFYRTKTVTSYPACSSQGTLTQCTRRNN